MDPVVDLYLNTDLTQQQIAEKFGCSRSKIKRILIRNGVNLKAKRKGIGGLKRSTKWRDLVLQACSRKKMTLLEEIGFPARNDRLLVSCPHHPAGRLVPAVNLIKSKNCCHTGNAQSKEGREQRAATLSSMWDDPEKRVPLLRSSSGHPGKRQTKLYICKIKAKTGEVVTKIGRSERGSKRYGSFLVESLWERDCSTEKAKVAETLAHLRFSDYSLEAELFTSGYTECYNSDLPLNEVIEFFESGLK